MEKLKVFEAFAGYGSQSIALQNINADFEIVGISEIDKYAIQGYYALHDNSIPNFGDISKINPKDLPQFDLFTYSFPCFIRDTKVLTYKGYKNIQDVEVGDYVLTHTNTYQKVTKTMNKLGWNIYELNTMSSEPLYVTEEHPIYVRKKLYKWDNDTKRKVRYFEAPEWVQVKDLSKDYYVGIAINQEEKLPSWKGVLYSWRNNNRTVKSDRISPHLDKPEFWWLIGRYLGDGWRRSQGGIVICCAFNEENEIIERLNILNFNYSIVKERTVNKIHIAFKEIGEFVSQFGNGAYNKHLTSDIFNLPPYLLRCLIDGYKSADGYYTRDGFNKITTISPDLAYGIGQCIAKAYHRPYSIYKYIRPNTCVIENRVVNQKDSYEIMWKDNIGKQDKAFYEDGIIWCPINSVKLTDRVEQVYNLEVENSNSYTANNLSVHNCQDVSISGHQKGLVKGKTRSGLLYECEKIIEHCKPKYLLLENVKNLVGKKFIDDFQEWLKYLESLGYTNYWKILSASDYGIAQKRERVFCVSILGEHKPFEFPEPIPLDKCIRDYMDDNVDEKYYLSEEQINKFLPNKNFAYSIYSILSHNDKINDLARAGMLDVKWRDQLKRIYFDNGCCPTLDTNGGGYHEPKILCIGFINSKDTDKKHQSNEVFDDNGVIRTITACDYKCPPIVGDFAVKTDIKSSQHNRVYDESGVSRALTASDYKHPAYIRIDKDYLPVMFIDNEESELYGKFILDLDLYMTIRKLTPIECLRLMGLKNEEIQKLVDSGLSNSRLYKLAGNSICVPVLEAIFREMLNT